MTKITSLGLTGACALALALAGTPAAAQKKYDPGASDTEIRIGNTLPYSGPASSYGTLGKVNAAYFQKVNDEGGVNGRRVRFLTLDDGYAPPKTVEMTRKLVESDEVLLMFGQLGTATNAAIQRYLNNKGVPHLFMMTGAGRFFDPKTSPWSMAFLPSYHTEGRIYAQHVLKTQPGAKIAVLYQNDDYGKEFLRGFTEGLGEKANQIVGTQSYEATDPTVDSQIVALKGSGATVFLNASLAKPASQAIRKAADIGWKPVHFVISTSSGISSTLTPAGLDNAVGIITAAYAKDPRDPRWENDPAMKDYLAFMKRYLPDTDALDAVNVAAYNTAQLLTAVLGQCGDNLTRENVMRQVSSLKDVRLPMLQPGILINTSPTDFQPVSQMQLQRFDGKRYVSFGELMSK